MPELPEYAGYRFGWIVLQNGRPYHCEREPYISSIGYRVHGGIVSLVSNYPLPIIVDRDKDVCIKLTGDQI